MPVIMWAYPRGAAIETKGGKDSLYAIDYAARVACELGADVVKINFPKMGDAKQPAPYPELKLEFDEGVRKVVRAAGRTMVLFSGGSKVGDDDLMNKARSAMESGATGLIFGRNMWQRPMTEALDVSRRVTEMMRGV